MEKYRSVFNESLDKTEGFQLSIRFLTSTSKLKKSTIQYIKEKSPTSDIKELNDSILVCFDDYTQLKLFSNKFNLNIID